MFGKNSANPFTLNIVQSQFEFQAAFVRRRFRVTASHADVVASLAFTDAREMR
jgi:hypothetical protein